MQKSKTRYSFYSICCMEEQKFKNTLKVIDINAIPLEYVTTLKMARDIIKKVVQKWCKLNTVSLHLISL